MLFNFDPAVRLVFFSFTGAIDAICGTVCDSIRCAMSRSWLCDCWVSLFNSLLSCFVGYRNHILRHNVNPQNKRWSREEYSLCLWAQDDLFKTRNSACTSTGLLCNCSGPILPCYVLVQVFPSKAIIGPRTSMAATMLALRSVRRVSTSPVVLREIAPSLMFVEIIMQESGRSGHGGLDPGSSPHTPLLLR